MLLREAIQKVSSLKYMVDKLDLQSNLGRRCLYESVWLKDSKLIEEELARIRVVAELMERPENNDQFDVICRNLMQVRDITGTVNHIFEQGILDDLELFELKSFALIVQELHVTLGNWSFIKIPDVEPVIDLLDPDKTRVPHFYIYDSYSTELAVLRASIKKKKCQCEKDSELEEMYFKTVELEDAVRKKLSLHIYKYASLIGEAVSKVGKLDVLLAKAKQVKEMGLCCPKVDSTVHTTIYEGIFNPRLKERLEQLGKQIQPVNIKIIRGVTIITGANMAGKTVLLKSVELAQYLTQFGFFVPARQAKVVLVDGVMICIGDEQDELAGLSSFASEILKIQEIITRVKRGEKLLILIDELARTTNPKEGKAIVNGVLEILMKQKSAALITTHYSGITASCRKLRVKGFIEENIREKVTLKNINEFIDYSLVEDINDVPKEALRVARLLGIDKELLEKAERFLEK